MADAPEPPRGVRCPPYHYLLEHGQARSAHEAARACGREASRAAAHQPLALGLQ